MDDKQFSLSFPDQVRRVGSLDQLGSVRRLTVADGPGEGMRLIEACTPAGIRAVFMESRALDVFELHYRGVNLGFMSKNGLHSGRVHLVSGEFQQDWPGGFLATCGLRNNGASSTDPSTGEFFPIHGRISGMAAEQTSIDLDWPNNRLVIRGRIQESALFGHRLVLDRQIEIKLNEPVIIWKDTVTNLTPEPEPIFILYHFNFGHPFLSPDLQLHFPPGSVIPCTENARQGLADFDRIIEPVDGFFEHVFSHLPLPSNPLKASVRLVNPVLGIKAELHFSTGELPILTEWKSMRSTDYALGIEPCNNLNRGRAEELANGYDQILPPFGSREFNLRLELT
jgi:hypothetical protein